jgi:glycosyltransferase involved in cell wall biosynthesis
LVRLARSGTQWAAFRRLDRAPAVIHVSDFARKLAEPLLPWRARHYTVTNPVVVEPCARAAVEDNSGFVFVGRLVPEKGCVELAGLAARAGVPIIFVGTGPCEAAIRAANPDARLLGWLPPAQAFEIVRKCRALIFPSKWHETSGLVCLEALANGVPVVASVRTAAAGVVQHGVTGMIVDPIDEAAMMAALVTLQDDDIILGMSRAAFARYWSAPPVVSQHVDDLAPVYLDLLEDAAPAVRSRTADLSA